MAAQEGTHDDDRLTAEELTNLVKRVFEPRPEDKALAVIVDLPDDEVPDTERWRERRALAAGWVKELMGARSEHGLEVSLFLYPNVHSNNADLPSFSLAVDRRHYPRSHRSTWQASSKSPWNRCFQTINW